MQDISSFYKIRSPLLDFPQGDDIDVYFIILKHDINDRNTGIDISNKDIKIELYKDFWAEELYNTFEEGSGIEILNATKGYFKWTMTGTQSGELDKLQHPYKLYFYEDNKRVTLINDFLEIV
jgi:hypothetical protein